MDDAVFWGVLSAATIGLIIVVVILVVASRDDRRRAAAAEAAASGVPQLIDVFEDAGERPARIRATVQAGESMVVEPVSGEPVLWFRLDGMGHPSGQQSDADVVFPFVIRRRGDVVLTDMMGVHARLAPTAGFVVPLDRFGHREFVVDDGFESMEYELTDDIRDRVRPFVGGHADRITTLDRLALLPGTEVTVTGLVRRDDDGWYMEGDEVTPLVVSALDDEDDATHPRPSQIPERDEQPAETSGRGGKGALAAAGGAMAVVGAGSMRHVPGGSSARRVVRTGARMGGRSGGAGGRVPASGDARRIANMGRRAARLGGGAGAGRAPSSGGAGQLRRLARGGGVRRLTRGRMGRGGSQLNRARSLTRGGGRGAVNRLGGSRLRRLTRLGRGGSMSRMGPRIRPPRVG